MRGVFFRTTAALLLLVVLLAPNAFASEATDTSLWAEFVIWMESRLSVPGGVALAAEVDFTFWLMSRLVVPGG